MKKSFSAIVLAGLLPLCGAAGTLDDAPFHVVVPSGDWKIDEATPKSMSKGVTLLATISNEHAHIKSFIIKETLQPPATNALDQLCGGLSESFTKRNVKKISESDAPFLGYPAKTFAYLIAHGSQTNFNETTMLVAGDNGWTITCAGRPEQSNEVQQVWSFFRK